MLPPEFIIHTFIFREGETCTLGASADTFDQPLPRIPTLHTAKYSTFSWDLALPYTYTGVHLHKRLILFLQSVYLKKH